jgi:hypothetical protein
MGNDVHRGEAMATLERRRDLPRCRPRSVEHDRLDLRSQAAEDRVDIGDGGINEKDFAGAGHGGVLNIFILVHFDLVVPHRVVAKSGPTISRGTHCSAPNLGGRRQLTGGPESGR